MREIQSGIMVSTQRYRAPLSLSHMSESLDTSVSLDATSNSPTGDDVSIGPRLSAFPVPGPYRPEYDPRQILLFSLTFIS